MLDDNWTSHSIEFLRQLMGAAEVHCRIIGERRDVPKYQRVVKYGGRLWALEFLRSEMETTATDAYIVEAVTVTTTEYRRATAGGEPTPS